MISSCDSSIPYVILIDGIWNHLRVAFTTAIYATSRISIAWTRVLAQTRAVPRTSLSWGSTRWWLPVRRLLVSQVLVRGHFSVVTSHRISLGGSAAFLQRNPGSSDQPCQIPWDPPRGARNKGISLPRRRARLVRLRSCDFKPHLYTGDSPVSTGNQPTGEA